MRVSAHHDQTDADTGKNDVLRVDVLEKDNSEKNFFYQENASEYNGCIGVPKVKDLEVTCEYINAWLKKH